MAERCPGCQGVGIQAPPEPNPRCLRCATRREAYLEQQIAEARLERDRLKLELDDLRIVAGRVLPYIDERTDGGRQLAHDLNHSIKHGVGDLTLTLAGLLPKDPNT